jgi:hypothetical protein
MEKNDYIEIDLLEILNKSIKHIREQRKILYASVFLSLTAALFYIYLKPEKYMTTYEKQVSYSVIPRVKIEVKQTIEMLCLIFEDNTAKEYLANQLNIPVSTLKKIKNVKLNNSIDNEFSMLINITIEGEDEQAIDTIANCIETYVLTNRYVKTRTEKQVIRNKALLSLVNNKIAYLDSSLFSQNNKVSSNTTSELQFAYTNSLNQMNYVELIDKKQELEEKISDEETPIQSINSESEQLLRVSGFKKKLLLIITFVSAGLFLFLFYIFVEKVRTNLKKNQY